eukprot:8486557-Karenia_brevis.AAC.1
MPPTTKLVGNSADLIWIVCASRTHARALELSGGSLSHKLGRVPNNQCTGQCYCEVYACYACGIPKPWHF